MNIDQWILFFKMTLGMKTENSYRFLHQKLRIDASLIAIKEPRGAGKKIPLRMLGLLHLCGVLRYVGICGRVNPL